MSGGYTIVETMIFLAVSAFILFISFIFLSGRDDHVRFQTSMRDTQSKIQDWLNDVTDGFAGGSNGVNGNYHCFSNGGKIEIDTGQANPANPNQSDAECIFLGKAIQVTDDTSSTAPDQNKKLYAYSVFGDRTISDGTDTRLVANLEEAKPFAAVSDGSCGQCADLSEEYDLNGTTKVLKVTSSKIDPDTGSVVTGGLSHLAGFYLSFNKLAANQNGNSDIRPYLYNLNESAYPATDSGNGLRVRDCISLQGTDCPRPFTRGGGGSTPSQWPESLSSWQICFGNDSNDDQALLTITSSNGVGVDTKLEFKTCN